MKLTDFTKIEYEDVHTPMGSYETTKENAEALKKFLKDKEKYAGACGGQFEWAFTPTSLGLILVVRDVMSKEEINITDYASW